MGHALFLIYKYLKIQKFVIKDVYVQENFVLHVKKVTLKILYLDFVNHVTRDVIIVKIKHVKNVILVLYKNSKIIQPFASNNVLTTSSNKAKIYAY